MTPDQDRRRTVAQLLAAAAAFGGAAGTLAAGARAPEPVVSTSAGAILLQGDGIDPTGAADSRAAVQAVLDAAPVGATIVNPSGSVLRLGGGLTVRAAHTRLTGSGEWRFVAGGDYGVDPEGQNGFVDVRADHCWVDGIRATNPDGVLNRGLCFLADFGRVTGSTLEGFGQGITISPAGEFHDFVVSGNHVLDVLGRGGGPSDTSRAGEDYGDGIVCWGASATVTGNVVTAQRGRDARIGIHAEGLDDQRRTEWTHDHRMVVIAGNVIHGPFRRGIVSEEVHHIAITGNAVADATWWSIALIGADSGTVVGNTLRYTRTAADTQGSAWGPVHAAITLYGIDAARPVRDAVVADNTIDVPRGATADAGVAVLGNVGDAVAARGCRIAGNRIRAEGELQHGVFARQPSEDLEVASNRVEGATTTGVRLQSPSGAQVRQNTVVGAGGGLGVDVEGGTGLLCDANTVRAVGTAVHAAGCAAGTLIRDNVLRAGGIGVDAAGTTGAVVCDRNLVTAPTPYTGLPPSTTGDAAPAG
ncbi:hypothetical protein [Amnibacterium endophyticum]|uniref:Right handed beta helix domain-containing protein n=1 Tax=Amnibacterium endophyticum TaxID=2109337 RepID=A0ABW4LA52_9MICO